MNLFHFYHPIEIRYGDLDPQGHVNNARYLTYLEQARIEYIMHLGLWDGQWFSQIGIILADAHLTFQAPIYFGQPIHVGVRTTRLGNKSLTVEYLIEDNSTHKEHAHGSTVLVTYDYENNQTIPIPENWRQRISEFEHLALE
jgi:acyl-CoA thioester hydrolase